MGDSGSSLGVGSEWVLWVDQSLEFGVGVTQGRNTSQKDACAHLLSPQQLLSWYVDIDAEHLLVGFQHLELLSSRAKNSISKMTNGRV